MADVTGKSDAHNPAASMTKGKASHEGAVAGTSPMPGAQTSAVTPAAARSAVGTRRACVGEASASRDRGRPASPPKAIPARKKARRCAKSRADPPERKA